MSGSSPTPRPILEARGLSVCYRSPLGRRTALREVDLAVCPGEIVGVVGESGSGKSSLLGALNRLLAPGAEITAEALRFEDVSLLDADPSRLRAIRGAGIAMIFQDPRASLNPVLRVGEQVAEVARRHLGASRRRAAFLAVETLGRVGLPEPDQLFRAFPHALSGGMCQRVMIAMALVGGPRVLLADEPTTALDTRTQADILALLRTLSAEGGLAVVLVSHDLRVVSDVADRLLVLRSGRVVEQGPAEDLLLAPADPYTRQLVSAVPRLGARKGPIRAPDAMLVGAGGEERRE
jgi:ABC-type glutathione transport system ATPase component